MKNNHQIISAYLGKPVKRVRGHYSWDGFRTEFVEIRREDPNTISRIIVGLYIWVVAFATIQGTLLSPKATPASSANTAQATPVTTASGLAAAITGQPSATPAVLAESIHAKILPGGPTGQLLPPGTMAPPYTYPNSYTRGQCTWYVAGRRQIPPNWHNAVSWYYNASASGWSVGTTPAVAAIAWTPEGAYGHVALVEQVSEDGTQVYVSEMNHPIAGRITYRWASAKSFKYIY